jgi:simple sugar transport system ATP-binding protein
VTAAALELRGIHKRFRAQAALAGADLVVRPGTVHALLGENGAGKSTLMRIAYGLERADAGDVRVNGRVARFASPADAIAAGIGMVHQHYAIVPAMTVAENVALGGRGRLDAKGSAERVREVGRETGLVLDPDALAGSLGVGAQQRLEIVKALARRAQLLILDEPTAVLAPAEAAELLRWVRGFADRGGAAVLITHKLREALGVADDVSVLRRGRTVLATPAAQTTADALAAAMTGGWNPGDADVRVATRSLPALGDVVLRVAGVSVTDDRGVLRLRDASGEVRAGEIVGVVGVEGSGQRELLRVLAGRLDATVGEVQRPVQVGFVPEDRHRDALALDFTLAENVALRGAGARRGRIGWSEMARRTRALLGRYDVRAEGEGQAARALSGGNQQKLVIGREVDGGAPALVVENPTRGLDVRASAAVFAELRRAREAGVAVVVYSSDLDEVLALADRVWSVYDGRVREVALDRAAVARAITGA